jgi:hypothetical protein
LIAIAVVSIGVVTACGASAPPARELAHELVDTLDVSDDVKDCMHGRVDSFSLSEEDAQGFTDLDDVAAKADSGNERAIQIMNDFQAALASCR